MSNFNNKVIDKLTAEDRRIPLKFKKIRSNIRMQVWSANQKFPYYSINIACPGVKLLCAFDAKKDQTLFLSQIRQDVLHKTMFPVGTLMKSEVKKIAVDNGLKKFAEKKESMGICFIGSRNFQQFISDYIEDKPGNFLDIDTGQIVGHHKGVHQWTLGQRAKLGGFSDPYFTVAKNLAENVIYVVQGTHHPALHNHLMFTNKPHWICSQPEELRSGGVLQCGFKFQHVDAIDDCVVCETQKGLIIKLLKSKRSLTPGQYAVLYRDNECLGSAKITFSPTDFTIDWININVSDNLTTKIEKYKLENKQILSKNVRSFAE